MHQTVAGYTCTVDNNLVSICTKDQSQGVSIVLVSTVKNITGNSVSFVLALAPVLAVFDTMDFSQTISLHFSSSAQLTFTYNGNRTVQFIDPGPDRQPQVRCLARQQPIQQ